jgi:hypothetical protein
LDFGSSRNNVRNALYGTPPDGVPQFRPPGGLNRHSRRAAAAQARRPIILPPSTTDLEAKIGARARDGKFCIEVVCGSWRGTFKLTPEAGERHLRECLEAMEALTPAPDMTEVERELMAESMAALKPAVIPPAAGNPFKMPPLTAGEIEAPGEIVVHEGASLRAHHKVATDMITILEPVT